jgi:hypothetical protein
MVNISIIDIVYSSIICMLSGLCIYLSLYYSATNGKHVLSELIDAKAGAHRLLVLTKAEDSAFVIT